MSCTTPLVIGRYALHGEIARGGMASVHLGRLCGVAGFSRTVAIKRLHEQFARDPEFVAMFIDEARMAGRIRHPHVVSVIDVVAMQGDLLLVMDFVRGVALNRLLEKERSSEHRMAPWIATKIACDLLSGLHAAHEARSERGEPLSIVHRDVSPQNILVDVDGNAHLIDFGIAKAVGRVQATREGQLKGKLCYMAPEQIRAMKVDRRTDIYAASVVLWEMLSGRRLFACEDQAAVVYAILEGNVPSLRSLAPDIPEALEAATMKGLSLKPENRFATGLDMAEEIAKALAPAPERDVGFWVTDTAPMALAHQADLLTEVESSADTMYSEETRPSAPCVGSVTPAISLDVDVDLEPSCSESGILNLRRRLVKWPAGAIGAMTAFCILLVAVVARVASNDPPEMIRSFASTGIVASLVPMLPNRAEPPSGSSLAEPPPARNPPDAARKPAKSHRPTGPADRTSTPASAASTVTLTNDKPAKKKKRDYGF